MKVVEITSEQVSQFNEFVASHPLGNIHQIRQWGVFQAKSKVRDKFWALALTDTGGEIQASALVIRQKLPFGQSWLFVPRGPLYSTDEQLKMIVEKIKILGRATRASFVRFELPLTEEMGFDPGIISARKAHAHYQPENTLILPISGSEEEILAQMKPKGRYNIRVARKHGVTVRSSVEEKDIETFYQLFLETTARDGFGGHDLKYYKNMVESLGPKRTRVYIAEYGPPATASTTPVLGTVVAALIATYFRDTVTYYFGASSCEHRNVMAPYLLHWQLICEARAAGYKYYDFFGVAPEGVSRHPWSGVTDFKLKFGGKRINYVPAVEIVLRPIHYAIICLLKKLRSLI